MSKKTVKFVDGFTIAELLIALAITAMITVALATAFNASIMNYQVNEGMFKAVNNARQALSRITAQLRTATAVDPSAPANQCTLLAADGSDITYLYNNSNNRLYLVTNDDLTDADYLLCDNVTAATFTKATAIEDSNEYVKSVVILMTVTSGDQSITLSAASVIRNNLD